MDQLKQLVWIYRKAANYIFIALNILYPAILCLVELEFILVLLISNKNLISSSCLCNSFGTIDYNIERCAWLFVHQRQVSLCCISPWEICEILECVRNLCFLWLRQQYLHVFWFLATFVCYTFRAVIAMSAKTMYIVGLAEMVDGLQVFVTIYLLEAVFLWF